MIHTKIASLEERQRVLAWYDRCPDIVKPTGITKTETGYSYDFVDGNSAHGDTNLVWRCAARFLWGSSHKPCQMMPQVAKYVAYVRPILVRATHVGTRRVSENAYYADRICELLMREVFTPVGLCHGDLTLENTVKISNDQIVFIDPGHDRGLPCQELDEAKILQSALGWETAKYGRSLPDRLEFKITRVHWLLLATHLARLTQHNHPRHALAWARQTMEVILNDLFDEKEDISTRVRNDAVTYGKLAYDRTT